MTVITNENFEEEVVNSEKPVLVDFYADWCGPCQMLSPIIEELSEEVKEVKFCKLNVDHAPELAQKYRVISIPTLKIITKGELVNTLIGLSSKEEVKAFISENI